MIKLFKTNETAQRIFERSGGGTKGIDRVVAWLKYRTIYHCGLKKKYRLWNK